MYILIGMIFAFLVLAAAIAGPSSDRFRNERPRGRRVPGDANAPQNIVAEETPFAPDGRYTPIPRWWL